MEWEWVLTIKMYMTDYADNTSYATLRYKIDKTAPQLYINNNSDWMSESSDYVYYWGSSDGKVVLHRL
jgi:hypothetical protein